jgi:hypothetical protein
MKGGERVDRVFSEVGWNKELNKYTELLFWRERKMLN